MFAINSVV